MSVKDRIGIAVVVLALVLAAVNVVNQAWKAHNREYHPTHFVNVLGDTVEVAKVNARARERR